jgi:hypothetical protein
LLSKAASYSWRCVIAHLNFPPTVLYTWSVSRFFRVCRQFHVILWRCSKEFALEHYHSPGVYDSKSMTAEYFVQRQRTTFQEWCLKIFRSAALWVCSIYNAPINWHPDSPPRDIVGIWFDIGSKVYKPPPYPGMFATKIPQNPPPWRSNLTKLPFFSTESSV